MDNFDAHISDESRECVEDELSSILCPLTPNCTSILQPLDVGVMGPFKNALRQIWLTENHGKLSAMEKRIVVIKRAIKAWESISSHAIISAFNKAIPKPAEMPIHTVSPS